MSRATIALSLTLLPSTLVLSGCDDPAAPETSEPHPPAIRVTVNTHGAAFDPDGYSVVLDGKTVAEMDIDKLSILLYPGASASQATVTIDDVAENCVVRDGRDRWYVSLAPGHIADISFDVDCEAPADLASMELLFVRSSDLHALGPGLENVRRLTDTEDASEPHVSSDGTTLAYLQAGVVHLAEVDASNPRVLGPAGRNFTSIDWSPDGSRLAVATGDGWWFGEVGVLPVDGGELLMFETPGVDYGATWSPDGSRIVLSRWSEDSPISLYTVRPDGTDPVLVTRGETPVWSPVSDDIAYVVSGEVRVVDLESGSEVEILSDDVWWRPTEWSDDGAFLLLERFEDLKMDIFIRRMSDGALYRVTRDGRSHSAVFLDSR